LHYNSSYSSPYLNNIILTIALEAVWILTNVPVVFSQLYFGQHVITIIVAQNIYNAFYSKELTAKRVTGRTFVPSWALRVMLHAKPLPVGSSSDGSVRSALEQSAFFLSFEYHTKP